MVTVEADPVKGSERFSPGLATVTGAISGGLGGLGEIVPQRRQGAQGWAPTEDRRRRRRQGPSATGQGHRSHRHRENVWGLPRHLYRYLSNGVPLSA